MSTLKLFIDRKKSVILSKCNEFQVSLQNLLNSSNNISNHEQYLEAFHTKFQYNFSTISSQIASTVLGGNVFKSELTAIADKFSTFNSLYHYADDGRYCSTALSVADKFSTFNPLYSCTDDGRYGSTALSACLQHDASPTITLNEPFNNTYRYKLTSVGLDENDKNPLISFSYNFFDEFDYIRHLFNCNRSPKLSPVYREILNYLYINITKKIIDSFKFLLSKVTMFALSLKMSAAYLYCSSKNGIRQLKRTKEILINMTFSSRFKVKFSYAKC